jgi:hypothetical protein
MDEIAKKKPRGRPFLPGNPGKPRGARNRTTVMLEQILEGEAEAIFRKLIEKAKDGDPAAIRMTVDFLLGGRRERPVPDLELPPLRSAADCAAASARVVDAVSEGKISPSEGEAIVRMIETTLRALNASEVEQRVSALEAKDEENEE